MYSKFSRNLGNENNDFFFNDYHSGIKTQKSNQVENKGFFSMKEYLEPMTKDY